MTERFALSAEQDGYRYLSTKDHGHFARIVVALEGEQPRADLEAQAELLASAPVLQAQLAEAVALLHTLMDVATEAAGDRQTYDFKPRAENAAVNARLFLARLGGAQ